MNYTVKAAARATGVSESSLRTWERRYGIPSPPRSASGRRLYDEDDLKVIRLMASLVESGISASDAAAAARSGERAPPKETEPEDPLVGVIVRAAHSFDEGSLVRAIEKASGQQGWADALTNVVFPAMKEIGRNWEVAALPSANEHFATELVRRALAAATHALPLPGDEAPQILVACPEEDRHDLGIAGLAFLLRSRGLRVIYLGADVPIAELVDLARMDIIHACCLSATSASGLASLVRASIALVRTASIPLFIGGPAVSPLGAVAAGLRLPDSLGDAADLIASRLGQA